MWSDCSDGFGRSPFEVLDNFQKKLAYIICSKDEGSSSMFVDLVTGKFGISSLESEKNMFPLMDNVRDMFFVVQEKRKSRDGNDE